MYTAIMVRRMSVREARAHFADMLGSVYHTGEPVIVERKGKPVAVLVGLAEFARRSGDPPTAIPPIGAELERVLERAPTIRALRQRPPSYSRTPGLTTKDMIQVAHEEAWRAREARST